VATALVRQVWRKQKRGRAYLHGVSVHSNRSDTAPVPLPRLSRPSLLPPLLQAANKREQKGVNMDPNQASGNDRENEKVERKEKDKGIKRRNRLFVRYLERRKTDTIVEDDASKGDISIATLVRRSYSDKTEYSAKLKGNFSSWTEFE